MSLMMLVNVKVVDSVYVRNSGCHQAHSWSKIIQNPVGMVGVYQKNTTLFDHPISILFIGSDAVTIWTDSFCPASRHGNSWRCKKELSLHENPKPTLP